MIKNIFTRFFYKKLFKSFGKGSFVQSFGRLLGPENISIGEKVSIHKSVWLQSLPLTGKKCCLSIGDGCSIGDFNHIVATECISIEADVLTANSVYISDNLHEYSNINIPVKKQPILQLRKVSIGRGSWLGEHVCVIGASIGAHCVVGANSVVTHDVPDYCVVVGAPARVIKRYNVTSQTWEKTDPQGNFIRS